MTVNPAILRRIDDALHFRQPDRTPVWEMLQHRGAFEHFAPSVPFPECAVIACERLGIDATYGFYDVPRPDAPPRGTSVVAGQTTWETRPTFATMSELLAWRPAPIDEATIAERALADHDARQRLCGSNLLYLPQTGGFEFIPGYHTETFLTFSEAVLTDLPALERYWDYQAAVARARNAATARHSLAPVVQCCIDVAYNTGLMVNPDLLRAHFFPRFREVITPLKDAGIKVVWHSDGDISAVLADAVAIGIDGINPIDPGAPGMDMAAIRRAFPRLLLVGNVGLGNVMSFGTPDQVRADVRRSLADAGHGGGHLLQCGAGQIMPDYPLENVIAYLDEARGVQGLTG